MIEPLKLFCLLLNEMLSSKDSTYYVNYVLKPEALIRIYAKTCNMSVEFAEKECRFGPDYDGDLPPERDSL